MNRSVYFINELKKAPDGGYIPCIAVEGETGFYATDWNWGDDLEKARKWADERNEIMGISQREAAQIVLGTMQSVK